MTLGQLIMPVPVDTLPRAVRLVDLTTGRRSQFSRPARCAKALLLMYCAGLLALPAQAAITAGDLQIMGRALGFLDKPLSGEVTVGIVYSADNPQSARDADDMQRMLQGGLRVGNVLLKPIMVSLERVAQANADV